MSRYVSSFQHFQTFLSARRRHLGLSPAGLAVRCDMTPDAIEHIEQGQSLPSPSQAYQLALVLGLDPVDLGRWAVTELLRHPEFLLEHVSEATA